MHLNRSRSLKGTKNQIYQRQIRLAGADFFLENDSLVLTIPRLIVGEETNTIFLGRLMSANGELNKKPQFWGRVKGIWDQTEEGGFGEILRVSLPLVASTASHTVLTFTDRMFLAWYSPTAIAASVPASLLSFTFTCFFLGTGQYVNVLIAQFFGAKQDEDLARSLWQGIYFSIVSAFLIILFIPLGLLIINNSGHSLAVIVEEKAYFQILMFGGGLIVMNAVLASFFSGRSRTKIVMYLSLMGAVLNIILNYILIFGKLGFPAMGIRGAGIATIIA